MRHTDAPPRYLGVLLALNVTFLLVSDFTGSRIIAIFGVGVSGNNFAIRPRDLLSFPWRFHRRNCSMSFPPIFTSMSRMEIRRGRVATSS